MAIIQRIVPEATFLRVVAAGEFSLEDAKRNFLKIVHAIAEHRSEKILVDGMGITGEPEVIERFYYGAFAAEMCHKHLYSAQDRIVPKFAYVLRKTVLDPQRFGETVARNRGMIIKGFDNHHEAYEWLGVTPAEKPEP